MPYGRKTGGGSRKGRPNKRTAAVQIAALKLVEDPIYRANMLQRLRDGTLGAGVETMLWHYAYGKPTEHIDLDVDGRLFVEILRFGDDSTAV